MAAEHGHRQDAVAQSHHDDTPYDGTLVVLRTVGDDTAGQRKHINQEVEDGEHDAGNLVGHTELGADEQRQHGIHNVIAEALTHVAQCGGD